MGSETHYIEQTVYFGKISGDRVFTERIHQCFEQERGFQKVLLTTSCTGTLEMAVLLLAIKSGDQVTIPSFTFVIATNAFMLRGTYILFTDSKALNPDLDA